MNQEEQLVVQLRPYESTIMFLQSIFLWTKPFLLAIFVLYVDVSFIIAHLMQMGIIAFIVLQYCLGYAAYVLYYRFGLSKFFSSKEEKDQIYTFEQICGLIASIKYHLLLISDALLGNAFKTGSGLKIIYVATVWSTLAYVFNIISKFWVFFVFVNLLMILPGLFFNPEAKDKIKQKFEQKQEKDHID